MFDCRPGHGTPIDVEKLRTLQVKGDRTRPRVDEGRVHPETGVRYKTVRLPEGFTTEHATKDDRVDAVATVQTVTAKRATDGSLRNV